MPGILTRSIDRALTVRNSRIISPDRERQMAAVVAYNQRRRMTKSTPELYRAWSMHAPLIRAIMDMRLGQLVLADWDLVQYDREGPTPDRGLMNRMRELLSQPNTSGEIFGEWAWAIGDDVLALDAGAIEKERRLNGEIAYLWPVDGGKIAVDRFWNGNPKSARYYWVPQANVEVPLLNDDLIYLMIHKRTYEPVGISYLEILRMTIEAELAGSLFNARQISQAAPDGIMDLGENARPEQVTAFKSFFASELAGKGSIGFWGGTKGSKFIPFRGSNREGQFIEFLTWEASKIAVVFQASPQDLGLLHDVNKANGEVQQQNSEDRGQKTFLARFQNSLTAEVCWDAGFGGRRNNIGFRFRAVSDRASLQKSEELKNALAGMPYDSINGARISIGLQPIGDPNDQKNPFNLLMANTPLGLATVDAVPNVRELLEARKNQTNAPGGGGVNPPKGDGDGGGSSKTSKAYEIETLKPDDYAIQFKRLSAKIDRMLEQQDSPVIEAALDRMTDAVTNIADRPINVTMHEGMVKVENPVTLSLPEGFVRVDAPVNLPKGMVEVQVDAPVSIAEGAVRVTNAAPEPIVQKKTRIRKSIERDPKTHEILQVTETEEDVE